MSLLLTFSALIQFHKASIVNFPMSSQSETIVWWPHVSCLSTRVSLYNLRLSPTSCMHGSIVQRTVIALHSFSPCRAEWRTLSCYVLRDKHSLTVDTTQTATSETISYSILSAAAHGLSEIVLNRSSLW